MINYLVTIFCIIFLFVPSVFASDIYRCPVQMIVGQIQDINGPIDEVKLMRNGERINVQNGQCLMYGDKIEVTTKVIVRIASVNENFLIGKFQRSVSWSAPNEEFFDYDSTFLYRFQQVMDELFKKNPDHSYFGAAREASQPCDDLNSRSRNQIKEINGLPTITQKVGSDLSTLSVAWDPNSGSGDVSIVLSHLDSKIITTKRICNNTNCLIDIPQETLHANDSLVLEAQDANGSLLRWNIIVVNPEQLPAPKESINDGWLLGAWRFIEAGPEFKLDSLSRISIGAKKSFVSHKLQDAVFMNEQF